MGSSQAVSQLRSTYIPFLLAAPISPTFLQVCSCVVLSRVQLFVTPWTVVCQAPLSMEILQARILEWIAMPSSRGSSQPRNRILVSRIAGRFFTDRANGEASMFRYIKILANESELRRRWAPFFLPICTSPYKAWLSILEPASSLMSKTGKYWDILYVRMFFFPMDMNFFI